MALSEEERSKITAISEQEPGDSQPQISAFIDVIACLRRKVIQLEQDLEQAYHYAYHDDLTGLPNRNLLRDRLDQAMAQAARQCKQVGLLMLDLDGFKGINDRFGHLAGDKLLRRVATRLRDCIRDEDTVSRYGGDEFVLLLTEVDGKHGLLEVAQKLSDQLARPYVVDNESVTITASIGIALYPADGNSQNDLIRRADVAMYLAKPRSNYPLRFLPQQAI
jgi:diguanylate cyclase (GGDEF)-like protein